MPIQAANSRLCLSLIDKWQTQVISMPYFNLDFHGAKSTDETDKNNFVVVFRYLFQLW